MFLAATSHPTAGANARRTVRNASLASMLTASALLTLALAPVAHAQQNGWSEPRPQVWRGLETWAEGSLVDVQVRVDGQAAPLYFAPGRGQDRRYLQAFAGRNYSLVLRNNTGRRVAVLVAVDGLNVVSGEISRLRPEEQMYVLSPWQTTTIRGWRTNLSEVRRFVFVDERRSYAERTGQANSDMGWIRVLSFRERQPLAWGQTKNFYRDSSPSLPAPPPQDAQDSRVRENDAKRDAAPPAPQASGKAVAPEAQDNMARGEANDGGTFPGTGWGERRHDPVRRVEFDPERRATDQLIFRYEYNSGLRALGILPVQGPWRERLSTRDSDLGFAKPPTW